MHTCRFSYECAWGLPATRGNTWRLWVSADKQRSRLYPAEDYPDVLCAGRDLSRPRPFGRFLKAVLIFRGWGKLNVRTIMVELIVVSFAEIGLFGGSVLWVFLLMASSLNFFKWRCMHELYASYRPASVLFILWTPPSGVLVSNIDLSNIVLLHYPDI